MTALQVYHAPVPGTQTISEGVEDFASYLVVERNCPETTVRAYTSDLRQLAEFLGDKAAMDVTMGDLRAWMEDLHARHAASTIGRKLACARTYFRFGCREGWAKVNPAKDLDLPRRDVVLPKVLTEDEVSDLVAEAKSIRDRAMIEVLYAGGLRVAELVGLNLDDLGDGCVKVMGKGGRERVCPIGQAMEALQSYLDERGRQPGALFLNCRGGRLSDRSVRSILEKLGANPHALRHSYATHLLDRGAGIRDVQELLGHKSITSTQIYTHVSPARKKTVHKEYHPKG